MNTKRLLVKLLKATFILGVLIVAISWDGLVYAVDPPPRIIASITYNWFKAENFGSEALLTLSIFESQDPGATLLWEEIRPADSSGFVFVGEWEHPVDLVPGMSLVVSDSNQEKRLVIEEVALDIFDPSADFLAGTAPAAPGGRYVWVGTGNESSGCSMDVIADPITGNWNADFSSQPCDITEDMWAAAQVFDGDGDATEANPPPPPPNPRFTIFPEWEWFDGMDWPDGAMISITVDDKSNCATTAGPSSGRFFNGGFPEVCDIAAGDVVTFTDGSTTQIHVVRNLSVTDWNVEEDSVTGLADAETQLIVWPHEHDPVFPIASLGGIWTADFSEIDFDLKENMGGRAEIHDEFGNATSVEWYIPNPHFTVFPEWEWFDGMDWPDGALIDISVAGKDCGTSVESWGGFFNGGFKEGCNVEVGDEVTFTDGVTTRTHTVRELAITTIDKGADIVSGTAENGSTVFTWVHELGYDMQLEATSGTWQANFGVAGLDLVENMGGRAEVRDVFGNATAVDWWIPNPHFTIFPEWEWFDGYDWPDGASVEISVAGKDCDTSVESWGGFFNGGFKEGCDVEVGDEITFTDGVTTRTHIVQNLAVTKVDQEDNIIKGIADAGTEVHVWPHATGQEQLAVTNPQGRWNADFTGIYDLMTGDGGRAEIRDEFGNATAVDWYVSQPRFTVFPDAQWFDGIDWPDGAIVSIEVKDKPECTFIRESWGGFFNGGFPEGCLVAAGDRVTFTDGTDTRKHIVRNLAIIVVNKEANTVAGTADSGEVIHTWVWNSDGSTVDGSYQEVTAVNGEWLADFGVLGITLETGMGIQAEIQDENGNVTSVDLPVPNPRIVASIAEDWFYLADLLPGATLELFIHTTEGDWYDDTRNADENGFAWIDSQGWDLEPGSYLVISDGNTTKNLEVEGFTFDVFDLILGRLQGTAPGPEGRYVWVGIGFENDGWSMDIFTDVDGNWVADFGTPVPTDYLWVAAQIFDEDGDASELRPDQIISP